MLPLQGRIMTLKLEASQHVPLSWLMLGYSCICPLFILEGQEGISVFHEHMFSKHPSCFKRKGGGGVAEIIFTIIAETTFSGRLFQYYQEAN